MPLPHKGAIATFAAKQPFFDAIKLLMWLLSCGGWLDQTQSRNGLRPFPTNSIVDVKVFRVTIWKNICSF